jgi:hypothetical protein
MNNPQCTHRTHHSHRLTQPGGYQKVGKGFRNYQAAPMDAITKNVQDVSYNFMPGKEWITLPTVLMALLGVGIIYAYNQ